MTSIDTLPVHPTTGLTAVGVLPDGRPVWPVLGASGDGSTGGDGDATPTDADGTDDSGQDDDAGDENALGDPGKKALEATKTKWKAEREKRRELEAELAELRKTTPKNDDNDDSGVDPEQIRREAAEAATAKANARIVRAEIKAAAAGKLADPADALRFLDIDQFEVDEDGEVDTEEVTEAITGLIKNKPYLAAQGGKRFQGSGDGGARKGGTPKQITSREELAKLSPVERLKAHAEGRLKTFLEQN